jgi:hypothetical protein
MRAPIPLSGHASRENQHPARPGRCKVALQAVSFRWEPVLPGGRDCGILDCYSRASSPSQRRAGRPKVRRRQARARTSRRSAKLSTGESPPMEGARTGERLAMRAWPNTAPPHGSSSAERPPNADSIPAKRPACVAPSTGRTDPKPCWGDLYCNRQTDQCTRYLRRGDACDGQNLCGYFLSCQKGTCGPLVPENTPCSSYWDAAAVFVRCSADLYCDPIDGGTAGVCRAPKNQGQSCLARDQCMFGLSCQQPYGNVAGTCAALSGAGTPCYDSQGCLDPFYCEGAVISATSPREGHCANRKPIGTECLDSGECADGSYCNDTGSTRRYFCVRQKAAGSACQVWDECESGSCDNGICATVQCPY